MKWLRRSWYRQLIKEALWSALRPKWRLESGVAVEVACEAEWIIYNDIFVDREYDPAFEQLGAVLAEQGRLDSLLVLDLGANVGFFTAALVDYCIRSGINLERLKIIAVEGSARLAGEFVRRNRPLFDKCALSVEVGIVGKREGSAHFIQGLFHIGNRLEFGKKGRDKYLDLLGLVSPDEMVALIKCDIEGSEFDFIDSYPDLLGRCKVLLVEFHDELCNVEACREKLAMLSFTSARVIRRMKAMSVELFVNDTSALRR